MTYSLLNATLNTLADFHRVFVCGHFSSACFEERQPVKNKQSNALERTKTPKSIACERWVKVLVWRVCFHRSPSVSERERAPLQNVRVESHV